MKKKTVISFKNLPMRMPLSFTALWALVLDRLNAPGYVWGAVGVLMLAIWFAWIHDVIQREEREIWFSGEDEQSNPERKSKFQERVEQLRKERE